MTLTLPPFLTEEQKAIITADKEHTLITAVAGSGKTTTLAWRIHFLLETGEDPRRMLILMFNRRAREDFQRKLISIGGDRALSLPEVRTYHAMGYRLYRRFVQEGALPEFNRDILTEQEIHFQVWQLLRQLAPEGQQEDIRRNKKDYIETASGFIDQVKTTIQPPERRFEELGYDPQYRFLIDVFHGFEQWRKRNSRISYADMLYEPVLAIHQSPRLQKLVTDKMNIILVDEYQDTNEIQHLLLRYIGGERARVTVVGDPDQTIYEFRGARPDFILHRFSEEFDQPVERTLSITFRHGHQLALAANHLITRNTERKDVLSQAHHQTPNTRVCLHQTDQDADKVIALVEKSKTPLSDIAVLFRLWSQSVPVELQLLAHRIPYRIDSGKGALFTTELTTMMQLMRVCAGHLPALPRESRQDIAYRLLKFPHCGLKEPELRNLAQSLGALQTDWGGSLLSLDFDSVSPLAARKLKRLGKALSELSGWKKPVHELMSRYRDETDLFDEIRSLAMTHDIAEERIETIQGFERYLRTLNTDLDSALDHLESLRQQAQHPGQEGVQLSTIHRTKGLEWETIIIPGLQDRHLPCAPAGEQLTTGIIESERRLLYVAVTRARRSLHLIGPARTRSSPSPVKAESISRFVPEMQLELSTELGKALSEETDRRLNISSPLTTVARRYTARLGRELLGPDITEETIQSGPVWTLERLEHAVFGPGAPVGEQDRSFDVHFDNGERRSFSKENAHLYFRPVS